MWCTRWYLPLVLLPLPIAPPYFLLLFIFSTTMHAKPCFYCIILLTAMFMASCYWPPVPLDTPLSSPWSDNITTFADALMSRIPDLPPELIPTSIHIVDRCWCDISSGFFEPFNTTQWEVNSVEQLRRELEQKILEVRGPVTPDDLDIDTGSHETMSDVSSTTSSRMSESTLNASWSLGSVWKSIVTRSAPSPPPQANISLVPSEPIPEEMPSPGASASILPPLHHAHQSLSWKEYDLRMYGIDLVVDFRW